jgi:hypothetical protein
MSTYQEVEAQVREGTSDSATSMNYANEGKEAFQEGIDQVGQTRRYAEAALGALLTAQERLGKAEEQYARAQDKAGDAYEKVEGAFQGAVNAAPYTEPALRALKTNEDGFEDIRRRSVGYKQDKIGSVINAVRALLDLTDDVIDFGDATVHDAQQIENASPAGITLTNEALSYMQQ